MTTQNTRAFTWSTMHGMLLTERWQLKLRTTSQVPTGTVGREVDGRRLGGKEIETAALSWVGELGTPPAVGHRPLGPAMMVRRGQCREWRRRQRRPVDRDASPAAEQALGGCWVVVSATVWRSDGVVLRDRRRRRSIVAQQFGNAVVVLARRPRLTERSAVILLNGVSSSSPITAVISMTNVIATVVVVVVVGSVLCRVAAELAAVFLVTAERRHRRHREQTTVYWVHATRHVHHV